MKLVTQGRYATIASSLALVVALGGTSYAAVVITGHDIKNGTVTTADVKNHNLRLKDFAPGARKGLRGAPGAAGAAGPQGAAGVQGVQGVTGDQGPIGPSNAFTVTNDNTTNLTGTSKIVLSQVLPAGAYVVNARATGYRTTGTGLAQVVCELVDDAAYDSTVATIPSGGPVSLYQGVALQIAFTRTAASTVALQCYDNAAAGNTAVYRKKLTAVRVGSVTSSTGPDVG